MSEFLGSVRRHGACVAFAVGALLASSGAARADTIWLNPKGMAEKDDIQAAIAPAKVLLDANGLGYVRCRILGATPGTPPQVQFEAWSPKGADGGEWSAQPYQLSADRIKSITHEIDGHLDLQLMLSSRDAADASGKTAPIGTPAWRTRMRRAIDPDNRLGSLADTEGRDPAPPETQAELDRITHRGWVIHRLAVEPPFNAPEDAAGRAEYDRLMAERLEKQGEEFRSAGGDLLHPRGLQRTGRDALISLIEGIARAEKYKFLADRQEAENADPNVVPRLPAGANPLHVPTSFVARATVAAGFLCTLAEMPHPTTPPTSVVLPPGYVYWTYGREARDALISILEQANPDRPTASSPGRLSLQASLPVDAAEKAIAAMRVVNNYSTFWEVEPTDVQRFVRALVMLARQVPTGASSRHNDLMLEARATLVRTLRPDVEGPASPLRGSSNRRPVGKELDTRSADAATFRAALDGFFTDPDPTIREAVQAVLADAGYNHVGSGKVAEDLFSLATGDSIPETTSREERRASRRYAITMLTVLGCLWDPRGSASPADKEVGRAVFEKLQRIRTQVETGQGSKGQVEFLELLPNLHRRIRNDDDLRDRAARILVLEKQFVSDAAATAREELEAMAGGTNADEERARLLADEVRRLERRAAAMPDPN
jgi:hypothetical protein